MKKMFFGSLLIFSGIIGILTLIVLSVAYPWTLNGIVGLKGFLLASKTMLLFIVCIINFIAGFGICLYEAYIRK